MGLRCPNPMTGEVKVGSGFTLLELLMVLAIIAILAALLLPGINRARSSAQRTICVNNLRQINAGIRMYADDSGGSAPGLATNAPSPWLAYKRMMKNYVALKGASSNGDTLFACPADRFYYPDFSAPRVSQSHHSQAIYDYSSYAFNAGNYHTNFAGIAG